MASNIDRTKQVILETVLNFFFTYIRRQQGTFVTLGGQGLEANLWHQSGLPQRNGFLIERNPGRAANLLQATHGYSCSHHLGTFARTLQAQRGSSARIDALHLDFCGQLDSQLRDARTLMPLLRLSTRPCLAVTVSAQRTTPNFNQPDCDKALYRQTVQTLTSQQLLIPQPKDLPRRFVRAEPHKGAETEFQLAQTIWRLCSPAGLYPNRVIRHIYISRYSGHSCRMRTILLHLSVTPISFISFLELWLNSELYFTREGETQKLLPTVSSYQPQENNMTGTNIKLARLRAVVIAMGDSDALALLDEIEKKAENYDKLVELMRTVINPATDKTPIKATKLATKKPAAKKQIKATDTSKDNSVAKLVKAKLTMLKAAATKDAAKLEQAYAETADQLGISRRRRGWRRQMGALLARANGKFRPHFLKQALETEKPDSPTTFFGGLASLYAKYTGKPTTAADLMVETKLA